MSVTSTLRSACRRARGRGQSRTRSLRITRPLAVESLEARLCMASLGTWETLAPMPVPSAGSAIGVIEGDLHVVNGHPSTGSVHQVYDSDTDAWSALAVPPFLITSQAAGVVNDKLYAAGGFRNSDTNQPTNVLHVYDVSANSWTTKAPMPTVRGDAAAAVIDNRLYVAGGNTHYSFDNPSFTALEVYDPSTDSWTTMAAMPTGREAAAGVALDGKFYVMGGFIRPSHLTTDTLEIYDPATNTWMTGAPMPTARSALAAGAIDGKIYAIGGHDGTDLVSVVEVYDPTSNTWSTDASMPTARWNLDSALLDGKLLAVGGADHSILLSVVEAFTPAPTNQPPNAEAGANQTVDEGSTVLLDATGASDSDGTIVSYRWDFGDGSSYTETALDAPDGVFDGQRIHLYSDNGLFTATLTVTDDDGATDSDAVDVTVVNSAPIVDAGSDQSVTLRESLTIVAKFDDPGRALGEGYTAAINWGDGHVTAGMIDVDAGTVTGSHTYQTAGNFTVSVTLTDDGDAAPAQVADAKSGSDSLNVVVIQPVTIDVKPGSDSNSINLASNGVIAVAIFTTADFDASQINASTVLFAGAFTLQSALEDVDLDGDLDMILHFRVQETVLDDLYAQLLADDINADGVLDATKQDVEVSLTGQTLDDQLFAGSDQLNVFLAGKSLRNLLDELAAVGLI